MHRPVPPLSRFLCRSAVALGLAIGMGHPLDARSADVTATPAPATAPRPPISEEQLLALVPERVGAWRRKSLDRPAPTGERDAEPFVEAVFRHGRREVRLQVASLGADAGVPFTGAAVDRRTAEGREKAYAEGDSAVRETHRDADGRTELRLLRPDGVVVIVRAHGVPGAELKALALAVRRSVPAR